MIQHRSLLGLAAALLLLAASAGLAAEPLPPRLVGFYESWLASVSHLMSDTERRAFRLLDDDQRRELFIRRFWESRDPRPEVPGNPVLERWHRNLEDARRRFRDPGDARARAMLAAGRPAGEITFGGCREVVRPMRIWTYDAWQAEHQSGQPGQQGFQLLFVVESKRFGPVLHHWSRRDGSAPLAGAARADWSLEQIVDYAAARGCFRSQSGARALRQALGSAIDADELRRRVVGEPPGLDWLEGLLREQSDPSRPPASPATLEIRYPGRVQQRTLLHGRVAVPVDRVRRNSAGQLFDRLVIDGDVWLGDRLVDTFRIVHHVAGAEPRGASVPLDFYRRLRPPARYRLSLRVADAFGVALLREVREIEVPRLTEEAVPPAGRRLGLPGLTRAEVGMLTTFPGVELRPPRGDLLVGTVEIATVTTGGPIARVDFLLDGQPAGSDGEPPYVARLELGPTPRRHTLEALARDPNGREIARDSAQLNAAPRRFAVRLVEPVLGGALERARAEVDVPAGETLERLELYWNDTLFATLHRPPFEHPLPPRPPERPRQATFVRAVATLASGASMEDLVVVGSATPFEEIDVELVQLYASVTDARGRFVTDLAASEVRVLEDGEAQELLRFEPVESLAINVALLMDVSSSMRKRVQLATASARRFFDTVLTEKDRASVLVFSHDIQVAVPFTNDAEKLRYGVGGFRGWGTTRLYDSLIYAVHSFGGLRSKRALVLLSDGADVDSDFHFKQVLEHTLRSGIAVYPIVLGEVEEATRGELEQLAAATGGARFAIRTVGELDRVYRRIEQDLRSQYLLVYRPPAKSRRAFRRVEVDVLRAGLEARTLHGYYP